MYKNICNAIFLAATLSFNGCSNSQKLDQQMYLSQVEIVNANGDPLYLALTSWGLNGNHNLFLLSKGKVSQKDLLTNTEGYRGVERLFYKVDQDTLELRLEDPLPISPKMFPNWVIRQRTYNGSELKDLLNDHGSLGYEILQ